METPNDTTGNGFRAKTPVGEVEVRGRDVILVVLLLAIGGLVYHQEEMITQQHQALTTSMDKLSCIMSLRDDGESRLGALRSTDPCGYAMSYRSSRRSERIDERPPGPGDPATHPPRREYPVSGFPAQ